MIESSFNEPTPHFFNEASAAVADPPVASIGSNTIAVSTGSFGGSF